MAIKDYETAAANNDGSGKLFPEGVLAAELNNRMRELQADLRQYANDADYFAFGDGSGEADINVLGLTTFRIVGSDQRAAYHVNRRIRAVGTATGTIHGSIESVAFTSGNTDVTVEWDSGALSVEDVEISLGNISANSASSMPRRVLGDFRVVGDLSADNIIRPVQNIQGFSFIDRVTLSGSNSIDIHEFTYDKQSADTLLVVDAVVSYMDREITSKVASLALLAGGVRRSFSIPQIIGDNTPGIAIGKGVYAGLSAGSKTIVSRFERSSQGMSFTVNPSGSDASEFANRSMVSAYTVMEF